MLQGDATLSIMRGANEEEQDLARLGGGPVGQMDKDDLTMSER